MDDEALITSSKAVQHIQELNGTPLSFSDSNQQFQ